MLAIERVVEDTVYLSLDKQAVDKLPAIPIRRLYSRGEPDVERFVKVTDARERADEVLGLAKICIVRQEWSVLLAELVEGGEIGQTSSCY